MISIKAGLLVGRGINNSEGREGNLIARLGEKAPRLRKVYLLSRAADLTRPFAFLCLFQLPSKITGFITQPSEEGVRKLVSPMRYMCAIGIRAPRIVES